jgi:putative tryptophan/tyrosine transport system substrate-binding protein
LVAGSPVAWPLAARAQQTAIPVIGLLHSGSAAVRADFLVQFRQGLTEHGYGEGRNVSIEYRWADDHFDRLPALAADLVSRQVSVIVTPGSTPATLAAKAATSTIPIVFSVSLDPVKLGLVASINRPAGNLTGVAFMSSMLLGKQIDLLHKLVPSATVIGFLVNPNFPDTVNQLNAVSAAADALGLKLVTGKARDEADFDQAFSTLQQQQIGGLLVQTDPFFFTQLKQLVLISRRYALPVLYGFREYVSAGGLMSYGPNNGDSWRLVGVYTGRILKGEKPADLPVIQSSRFELVMNLKTAKALDIKISGDLLSLADEVIE